MLFSSWFYPRGALAAAGGAPHAGTPTPNYFTRLPAAGCDDVVHAAARRLRAGHRGVPRHGVIHGGRRRLPTLHPVHSGTVRVRVLGAIHHVALVDPELHVVRAQRRLGPVRVHGLDLEVDLPAAEHVVVREAGDLEGRGRGRRGLNRRALAAQIVAPGVLDENEAVGRVAGVADGHRVARVGARVVGLRDPLVVHRAELGDGAELQHLPRLRLGLATMDDDLNAAVSAVVLGPLRDDHAVGTMDDAGVADLASLLPAGRERTAVFARVRERLPGLNPALGHWVHAVLGRLDRLGVLVDRHDDLVGLLELADLGTHRLLNDDVDVSGRRGSRARVLRHSDSRRLREALLCLVGVRGGRRGEGSPDCQGGNQDLRGGRDHGHLLRAAEGCLGCRMIRPNNHHKSIRLNRTI
jgi:hypothetical protein